MSTSTPQITPFLMFEGTAEEAITFYLSVFEDSNLEQMERFGPGGPAEEGSVMQAIFRLGGQRFRCFDSYVKHDFAFTPAISLWVTCATEQEIDRRFAMLSEGGEILMPLAEYPFAPKYAWVQDRFGVSWQLALEP